MDSTWVEEFLVKVGASVNGVLEVDVGGQTIKAQLEDDVKTFLLGNKLLLVRLGKESFRNFLFLVHQKRDEEAFMLLLAKMDADQLISVLKQDAAELSQYNTMMENFIAKVKQLLISTSLRLASKALFAMLL